MKNKKSRMPIIDDSGIVAPYGPRPAKRGAVEVERLKAIKDRDQATNEELARKIGVSMAAVYGWTARGRLPSPMGLRLLRRFITRDERDENKK